MNRAQFRSAYIAITQIRRFAATTIEASDNDKITYLLFEIGKLAEEAKHIMQDIDENSIV